MRFGKKLCESCCDIYQNDDWTKQSAFMSSDPPQVDISKAEVPVEHDQKSILTVVLDLALTELMKRLKLLIYTYWDHFSLYIYTYITHTQQIMLYT